MPLARYSFESTDAMCKCENFTVKDLVSSSVGHTKHLIWHNFSTTVGMFFSLLGLVCFL